VSYSHADAVWKDRLVRHLRILERQGELEIWDDDRIDVGDEWWDVIDANLDAASVALLLVSANSLTSEFILSTEVPRLLDLRRRGLTLMPVIVSPCAWDEVEWLAKIQAFGKGVPLSTLADPEVDLQLTALTRQLSTLIRYEKQIKEGRLPPPTAPGGAYPPPLAYSTAEAHVERIEAEPLERYEVVKVVQEGSYGRVLKCTVRATGETCIVKETDAARVSEQAFEALAGIRCPNIAAPVRVWKTAEKLYEQLPYVGGLALEDAIAPGIGGLDGGMLESFYRQISSVLGLLHSVGIVHRDLHPSNVYLVVRRPSELADLEETDPESAWIFDAFGDRDDAFLVAWILVDLTFAALVDDETQEAYLHGPYTPEEQQHGAATTASDIYSLGATMFFGNTGSDPPSALDRRVNPTAERQPVRPAYLEKYLRAALALDPADRPLATTRLDTGSIAPGFAGVMRAAEDRYVLVDDFPVLTRLVSRSEAVLALQQMNRGGTPDSWLAHLANWVARG